MDTRILYLILVGMVAARNIEPEVAGLGQRIVRSNNADGYSLATLHALDTATGQHIGQTKRDIEAHAADATSDKSDFSLVLSSGERLRMTLNRRSIDTTGATLTEVKEDGKRETSKLQARDCFFSGQLQGEEGFASLAMCGGSLMGSVSTAKRQYEVYSPADLNDKRSADDAMRVLVTFRNIDSETMKRQIADQFDGVAVPEVSEDAGDKKRTVADRKATIEIADFLDEHYINNVQNQLGLSTTAQLTDLILAKWSTAALVLSDAEWIGWDITLRLVALEIWRSNPSWYVTASSDTLMKRMTKVCDQAKLTSMPYDTIMLHTGSPINDYRLGISWIGGFCSSQYKCASVKTIDTDFYPELHEFGHSIGLDHEPNMAECSTDSDPEKGFMSTGKDHFRGCYRERLETYFTHFKKACIFKNTSPNLIKEY